MMLIVKMMAMVMVVMILNYDVDSEDDGNGDGSDDTYNDIVVCVCANDAVLSWDVANWN